LHTGSITDKNAVAHGLNLIMEEKPDVIIVSGDLVNDRASELEKYVDIFSKLNAPFGVYSTMGNHDYGDYTSWPHEGISKQQNMENIKNVNEARSWKLLLNEHVALERGDQAIAILGVENWGAKARFPKYGDMKKATAG